jgi:Heavy metal binding domain
MKILNLLLPILLAISFFSVTAQSDSLKKPFLHSYIIEEPVYTCPLHGTLVVHQPGLCPICGMRLIKAAQENTRAGVLKMYACPMHPFISSEKPGRCIKCGLNLIATNMAYCCSNHPAIARDRPGKCPECGNLLKLTPVLKIAAAPIYSYRCAIHKTVSSNIPGRCYACGAALTKSKF